MKTKQVHSPLNGLLACACAATLFTACSTTPQGEYTSVVATEEGVPGGTVLETFTTTATVTGLDPAKRAYTLKRKDGKESTFTAPPEMVNYDQLRVGDRVTATRSEQMAISLRPTGTPAGPAESSVVSLAPKGAKPGMFAVQTTEFTATVWTVNVARHEVKLRMGDGGVKTFKVRTGVNLNKVVPGDVVVATMTESVTIKVEGH
jgi:hypothetical protein